MYPGLSHDEIIEECIKELNHYFEVGPEVALISAEKGVQCVPFDESLQKKFPYFEGTYEVFDVPHTQKELQQIFGPHFLFQLKYCWLSISLFTLDCLKRLSTMYPKSVWKN